MRALVVTGTDTAVGKTVVVAGLAAVAHAQGQRVAVVKPAQSGVADDEPGDLAEISRLSGVVDVHELARFSEPLAPGTAARRAGRSGPSPALVATLVERLADRDLVLIEGSGGALVHLDTAGGTILDVATLLGAPVVVIAHAGLGTLNAAALTCEGIRRRGLCCLGVIIGCWPAEPHLVARCNLDDLPLYAGARLIGRMPDGAAQLDRKAFLAAARAGIDSAIWRPAPVVATA